MKLTDIDFAAPARVQFTMKCACCGGTTFTAEFKNIGDGPVIDELLTEVFHITLKCTGCSVLAQNLGGLIW